MVGQSKWGCGAACPACGKTVYPADGRVFGADRRAWHRACIHCAVKGCRYSLLIMTGHYFLRKTWKYFDSSQTNFVAEMSCSTEG